ncbi:hypothetical protein Hdeb2414_s0004g00124201 [Helianthus debilis subsp. tardiflorus]
MRGKASEEEWQEILCTVADRIKMGTNGSGWFWSWKRPLASPTELTELVNLIHLMRGFVLTSDADRWTWVAHDSGVFSVCSLKEFHSTCSSKCSELHAHMEQLGSQESLLACVEGR